MLCGRIDGVTEFEYPVELAAGESRTVCVSPAEIPGLHLENPRLWWPNAVMAVRRCDDLDRG